MTKLERVAAIALAVFILTIAPPAASVVSLEREAMHADIDFVVDKIVLAHPGFHAASERSRQFRQQADALKRSMEEPMSRPRFYARLATLINTLRDGHTEMLWPSADVMAYLEDGGLIFPVDIEVLEGKLYVGRNYRQEDATLPRGARLLSINGVPADEFLDEILSLVPSATPGWRERRLSGQNDLAKALIWARYGWQGPFRIRYSHKDRSREIRLPGITRSDMKAQREERPDEPPIVYDRLEETIGSLRVRSFALEEKAFEKVLDRALQSLRKHGPESLIVDVRDNPGGDSANAEVLLSAFIEQPVSLNRAVSVRASADFKAQMKERIPGFVRWLPVQHLDREGHRIWSADEGDMVAIDEPPVEPRRASRRYRGRVYVLTNGGTFSTASMFAAAIKRHELGTLVGQASGGSATTMLAHPLRFTLPNSELVLQVSSMRFHVDGQVAAQPPGGVVPDVHVRRTLPAILSDTDSTLEAAVNHAREASGGPRSGVADGKNSSIADGIGFYSGP
ncbi:MAG: S41 family peptidase [Wenzhouxiangellaceae bacterium]